MAMRDGRPQPLALRGATILAGHVRGRPGLVDEDELLGIEIELAVEPCLAALQNVRPILLACMGGLFFQVTPWRSKKRHNEPTLKLWPRSASCA